MSGPIQNVYFTNPIVETQITTLQEQVGELRNQVGYGQTLSTAGEIGANSYLQTFTYGGRLVGGDANDAKHQGGFFYGGNAKSGQEMFFGTGYINSSNSAWTTDTKYNFASAGKIVTGLVCAKMIEEGLISPFDPIWTLSPTLTSLFTGTAQYYDSITIDYPAAFPAPVIPGVLNSYTGTTGSYNLNDLTLGNVLQFGVGIVDDFFILPGAGMFTSIGQFGTGPTSLYVLSGGSPTNPDKANLIQQYTFINSLLNDGTSAYGFASKIFNGLPVDPVTIISNSVTDALTRAKTGVMPLAYKPGSKSEQAPYNVRTLNATYDTAYILLGYILEERLRYLVSLGFLPFGTNFATYARAKFFTPLGMNNTTVMLQETLSGTNSTLSDSAFRRSILYGAANSPAFSGAIQGITTWPSFGCSPSYATGASNLYLATTTPTQGSTGAGGPSVWARNTSYSDDGIAKVINAYYFTGAGSTGAYPVGNAPIVASIGDFGKLIQLIANKGLNPFSTTGERLIKTETWNYFISCKVGSFASLGAYTAIAEGVLNESNGSAFYTMGSLRVANDNSAITAYGFDTTTMYFGGAMGVQYYVDFYTGNWFIAGIPEIVLSTGDLQQPQSAIDGIAAAIPDPFGPFPAGGIKATSIALSPFLIKHSQDFLIGMTK